MDVTRLSSTAQDDISYPATRASDKINLGVGCRGYIIVDIKWRSGQSFGFRCFAHICFDIPPPHILVIHHTPPPPQTTDSPSHFTHCESFYCSCFRFIIAAVAVEENGSEYHRWRSD